MNRIRTIKPEFWSSEDIMALPRDVRLTFIGLWSYADDYGYGNANAVLIKAQLYPTDDDLTPEVVDHHLDLLEDGGQIGFYEVGNRTYFSILAWSTHQRVDRPSPSNIPAPRERDSTPLASGRDGGSRAAQTTDRDPAPDPLAVEGKREGEGPAGEREESEREGSSRAGPPSAFCNRHQPLGTKANCRACGTARLAHNQWIRESMEENSDED